ncbi:sensor histidine kinase [Horticoccus sp. 23ND18S-11]|uniref:sensor histidine kinase n=1 Tax=Horticoccus sp. 23ND18S-11 TaxID=3391832 RepID=UPI0039C9657C
MPPPSQFSCLLGCFLLTASGWAARPSVAPAPISDPAAVPALMTVAEVFARWPEATTDELPVQLTGVVTGTMPNGAFRLHDGELGIYVTRSPAGRALTPGDRVAVAGVLRKGGFSPWITPHAVTSLGRGVFPVAQSASYSLLASGAADNQWVEIVGVVRSVDVPEPRDFVVLDVGISGGNLRVLVNYAAQPDFAALVDAEVRIRGVAAVNVNKHGHVVEPSFRVPSFDEITVTRPAPAGAFDLPLLPVNRLLRFSPGVAQQHRVRTAGVVTRRFSDRMFFLRDGAVGLKVEASGPVVFRPGDEIEVAGFPVMSEGLAVLQQAVGRVRRAANPPEPVVPAMTALLDGTHNSDLVKISARLVDWAVTGPSVTLIFQAGDQLFKGLLNQPAGVPLALPEKNSWVNVSGICVISELEDIWFYQPRSFLLLVADLSDVQIVQAPPWWTPERLWRALAITGVVLLAAAGWVWSLRRQINRKRAVIEQQARHAAALEERSRIARELHDTLEQGLTGLSLQMKALETDLSEASAPARSRLQFARQMLRQSRALARNAIRELRAEAVTPRLEGLVDGLQRVATAWNHSGALVVDVRIDGPARLLPPRIENHLLGIGTEAMTNAVKHGRAAAIRVVLAFRPGEVLLRVTDNGDGFDPAEHLDKASGCFGLLGMRERAREIRGQIRIDSRPGHGAEIVVTAPVPHANEAGSLSLQLLPIP